MPKRSNDFQRLIKLIESQLAEENITITESKLLEDKRNDVQREVDILIETEVNGHPVNIAIECRDHKRKSGMQWIDSLIGKYEYLPIHKIIAVSRSGFTDTAYEAATKSNIELLTLEKAIEEDWVRDVKNIDAMYITLVRFIPVSIFYESNQVLFEKDESKISVFNLEGKRLGNLDKYRTSIFNKPDIKNPMRETLIKAYDEEKGDFKKGNIAEAKWTLKKPLILKDDFGFEIEIKSISYKFKCKVEKASVPTQKYKYGEAQVATVTNEMHDMKVMMSVSESKQREPNLAIFLEIDLNNGKVFKDEIITAPLPQNEGPIKFTRYMLG